MPGFIDTHVQMLRVPTAVVLHNSRSVAEVQELVEAKAKEFGPGEWITGSPNTI